MTGGGGGGFPTGWNSSGNYGDDMMLDLDDIPDLEWNIDIQN